MFQKSWFKEPFIHFVFLGLILFIGHAFWASAQSKDTTIHVETAEMERQALIFAGENRREPTDENLKALLYSYIEEEVLVREALKRGLDEGDTIIRRRLAQKMRFLIEDITPISDPTDETLRAWFEPRKSNFSTPETLSFTHIYFSPEAHGDDVFQIASAKMNDLISGQETRDIMTLGDPFMLQKEFRNVTAVNIRNLFGAEFSNTLFKHASKVENQDGWLGVMMSPFGVHVVRIDNHTPMIEAEFETVKAKVLQDWTDQQKRIQNKKALKDLLSQYVVKVEGVDE